MSSWAREHPDETARIATHDTPHFPASQWHSRCANCSHVSADHQNGVCVVWVHEPRYSQDPGDDLHPCRCEVFS